MAVVKPFRAVRYDAEAAGPLESLVSPPYDVISPSERDEYRGRSPYNVVHLTLPDSAGRRGARLARVAGGRHARPRRSSRGLGALAGLPGPDGYKRTRRGSSPRSRRSRTRAARSFRTSARSRARKRSGCASCRPSARSSSRSSCCTRARRRVGHRRAGPRAGRDPAVPGRPDRRRAVLRRAAAADRGRAPPLRDRARRRHGHPDRARLDLDQGLVDPADPSDRGPRRPGERHRDRRPADQLPGVVVYAAAAGTSCSTATAWTSRWSSAPARRTSATRPAARRPIAAVDGGGAEAAYLVRPVPVADVFERARRGEVMPQKTHVLLPEAGLGPPLPPA